MVYKIRELYQKITINSQYNPIWNSDNYFLANTTPFLLLLHLWRLAITPFEWRPVQQKSDLRIVSNQTTFPRIFGGFLCCVSWEVVIIIMCNVWMKWLVVVVLVSSCLGADLEISSSNKPHSSVCGSYKYTVWEEENAMTNGVESRGRTRNFILLLPPLAPSSVGSAVLLQQTTRGVGAVVNSMALNYLRETNTK